MQRALAQVEWQTETKKRAGKETEVEKNIV